jgi:hypothetical protein
MMSSSEDAFERYRADLLAILEKVCGQNFDAEKCSLVFELFKLDPWVPAAGRTKPLPTADYTKLLVKLRNSLREARQTVGEVMRNRVLHFRLFGAWCDEQIDRDLQDVIEVQLDHEFHKLAKDVVAGLAALETAAFRAAEKRRKRPGRPRGTGILPPGFIIELESAYRYMTGKPGGAGPGPFARFVKKVLESRGCTITEQSVIEAIKTAKKHKEWGRSFFGLRAGETL